MRRGARDEDGSIAILSQSSVIREVLLHCGLFKG